MKDLAGIRADVAGAAHKGLAGMLAELGGTGLNQHTRLLRLHTPLGPEVLLAERVTITETFSPGTSWLSKGAEPPHGTGLLTGFGMDLLAVSTRADLHAPELLGQPVLLELLTAASLTQLRPFHGHVTRFELLGSDGGLARYRLHIEPWTAFLAQRTDAWVFQDMNVLDLTEAVFADYMQQGRLMPQWRIDVADRAAFANRSLCTQFNETDLAFLQRLWAEEGLFAWFEHQGAPQDARTLGAHTLVIADHNGAFQPNAQSRIRYTQPGAVLKEDSITRWHGHRRVDSSAVQTASWDYRTVSSHTASAEADAAHEQPMRLAHTDQPGAYAYETPAQAERRALIQLQSLQAQRKRFDAAATVRTLQPGTTFTLLGHPEHEAGLVQGDTGEAQFVVLGVVHRARNNLSADAQAGLQHVLGHVPEFGQLQAVANDSDEPLYEARFCAQRTSVPVRASARNDHGRLVLTRPTVWGTQTAVVVGLDAPVHTDRDGRVKVQFHWQRGARGSHRLSAPLDDNAPASDASGTWVRVAQAWGGANWGSVFIPRLGQEVLVEFIEGDIDRPVIVGSTYNGEGQPDAQGNRVASGAAQATGNAPAWFPGAERQGEHEGHAHTATLSGFKSQSLEASQAGSGGHNQLVLDDTPGQGRTLLHTTQSQTWLQMGHLLQQHDNQRLAPRGHGLELHTQAQGALRAAQGLHLSTHARAGGTSSSQGQPMQTREAQTQLRSHAELLNALHGNAQTHLAKLPGETEPDKLPAHAALQATLQSLGATQQSGGGGDSHEGGSTASAGEGQTIDGGHGSIPVTERPDLVLSAAGDIAALTPAHTVLSTGQHTTLTAGQDIDLLAQRHQAWAVKDGISLFTRGEAKDTQRAVQDVGMKLHAASGNVRTEAQSDAFTLTAQKAIDLQSTAANIVISAPNRIVLNGGGGYVKIEGGNIEIGTSGKASFKAVAKELAGGSSASAATVTMPKVSSLKGCAKRMRDAAASGAAV